MLRADFLFCIAEQLELNAVCIDQGHCSFGLTRCLRRSDVLSTREKL